LIEDLPGGVYINNITVPYLSLVSEETQKEINSIAPLGPSSVIQVKNKKLLVKTSTIHKQNTNLGKVSLKVSGGNAPYTFDTKGLSFNQIKNDSIVLDNLYEGRYIVDITDANQNAITAPIYIDGPNGICSEGIELIVPSQNGELNSKITWEEKALLQYKPVDSNNWITVLDFDGETILDLPNGEYEIRSKYPCVNGDIYSDTITITIDPADCIDTSPPVINCPDDVSNICAPVFISPKTLVDFNPTDNCTAYDLLSFNVDLQTNVSTDFTTYTYTYTITDQAGNTTFCEERYNVINQFLEAPKDVSPYPICENALWSHIKSGQGKYHFYEDYNGKPGNIMSDCDSHGIVCSTVDLGVDTSTPGTYTFWIAEVITFPDGSICESDPSQFSLIVNPKPTATLTNTSIDHTTGNNIELMDFVEVNKSGYWTGPNVVTVVDINNNIIPYFITDKPGKFKLYYTVKNNNCENSYLLLVNVELSINLFKMYPNPTNGKLKLSLDRNVNPKSSTIYNIKGIAVEYFNLTEKDIELDLGHLKKGIYLVEIKTAQSSSIQKLFIGILCKRVFNF